MRYIAPVAALALLTGLASCAAPPPSYMAPPNLTSQTGASVIGSMTIDPSPLIPNTEAILSEVDNQPTALGQKGWEIPTLVAPGTHTFSVNICRCNSLLGGGTSFGSVTLLATVKAGGNYTIYTTIPTGFTGYERHFVTVWIEDGTGTSIIPKAKFELDGANPPIVQLFEH